MFDIIQALVGFSKNLTQLDGRQVVVTKTDITKPGDVSLFIYDMYMMKWMKIDMEE